MDFNLIKLDKIIRSSGFELKEKEELLLLFTKASDKELCTLSKLLEKNPNWITEVYKNYITKKKAFRHGDNVVWQKILQQEYNYLREIESLNY